jgi:Cd2+/Zn2+-exporting ATPase
MVLAALGAAVVGAPFEGAMLLFLFSLSNVLQAYAIDRTRKAIKSLMKLRPDKALVRRDDGIELVPVDELVIGDVLVVRPGESIALDSVIIEGTSSVDQSSLTGESMPVSKKAGDPVFAGTINQTGGLEVRVAKLAKDSTIEKLVRMVEEAQTEKAETQRFLDRAEQFYAVGVILFAVGLIVVPVVFLKEPFQSAFYRSNDCDGRGVAVRAGSSVRRHPFFSAIGRGAAWCPFQRRRAPRTHRHRQGRRARQDGHAPPKAGRGLPT